MIDKRLVLKWLILFNVILVVLYLLSNHILEVPSYTIRHWFDLDEEANIPTWFASSQLFLLFILSITYSRQIESKHLRGFYVLVGLVFLFFSADEAAKIHEGVSSILNKLSIESFFPNARGMWITVYSVVLIILGSIFWKGLAAFWNEKTGRTVFLVGAVVFVVGGVGLEVFAYYWIQYRGAESVVYVIEVTVEESLELLGPSLMIYSMLAKHHFMRSGAVE